MRSGSTIRSMMPFFQLRTRLYDRLRAFSTSRTAWLKFRLFGLRFCTVSYTPRGKCW